MNLGVSLGWPGLFSQIGLGLDIVISSGKFVVAGLVRDDGSSQKIRTRLGLISIFCGPECECG